MKKYIPNTITCCNLGVGCVAIVMALQGAYTAAMVCILWCALFDFLDGLAARLLNAYSPLGKELDSLADVVSFGVAPAAMVFSILQELTYPVFLQPIQDYIPPLGFLIAIFSGLRLAKFNVDTRQKDSFIGLPVPANALFWASLIVAYGEYLKSTVYGLFILLPAVLLFSYLLVSELPMFSLKFKNLKWHDNKVSFIFLLACIPMIILLKEGSAAFIIVWYILLSILTHWKRIA